MKSLTFAELGVAAPLLDALARLDITEPTPVQQQALPILLAGRDLVGCAPTGTGKTAAFMLPALQRIAADERGSDRRKGAGPRVLVLTPTRELAQQVNRATRDFAVTLRGLSTVCVTGGEPYPLQNRQLASPYEVLVATPGRLMDQIDKRRIVLDRVEVLVLDEADRMLDMGFADEVFAIAQRLPRTRQTVCFTATVSAAVRDLASRLLNAPEWLTVERLRGEAAPIDQHVLYVDGPEHRARLLQACLTDEGLGQAIVFTDTRRHAEELSRELFRQGIASQALHGDLNQRDRTRALTKLRRGECKVLVATDVAARGLDVSTVTHVINYALPKFAEDYVHRIGRTGRAGASGQAVSFVGREDVPALRRIEKFIGHSVPVSEIEGHAARFVPSAFERRAGRGAPRGRPAGRPGSGARPGGARSGGARLAATDGRSARVRRDRMP